MWISFSFLHPKSLDFSRTVTLSHILSTLSTFINPLILLDLLENLLFSIQKTRAIIWEQNQNVGEGIIMADIILDGNNLLSSTCIPNIFIDKYMTNANGEFVKIYLYLLRCMSQNKQTCTLSELADAFEHTEKDILRALSYWEKVHLLHVEYNANREVSGILLKFPDSEGTLNASFPAPLLKDASPSMALSVDPSAEPEEKKLPKSQEYTLEQLENFKDNESVQEILFITEHYLGRTLNPTDIRTILYWYDGLRFSTDLIEYLIETCISNGHTSLRYMEKIALSWAKAGISTVEEAKQERSLHHQDVYAVMKAFGISGRSLISSELQAIRKWTSSYALSMDIIKEACKRTIQATGKASFEYADTILNNWHRNQVQTLNDVLKLDAAHQKSKAAAKASETAKRAASGNRFNNFPQRTYNYDQLEKQLLNTTR